MTITWRVTTTTQDHTGHTWAHIAGPFTGPGDAARYAETIRQENPAAQVDVLAITDRGDTLPQPPPKRTPATDQARDRVMAHARHLQIIKPIAQLDR